MKRISLALSFALAVCAGACASESDVTCDVVWTVDDQEVGQTTFVYEALDDVDLGVDMCKEDQAEHEERPAETNGFHCNCST